MEAHAPAAAPLRSVDNHKPRDGGLRRPRASGTTPYVDARGLLSRPEFERSPIELELAQCGLLCDSGRLRTQYQGPAAGDRRRVCRDRVANRAVPLPLG